jgi:hypothetical protein
MEISEQKPISFNLKVFLFLCGISVANIVFVYTGVLRGISEYTKYVGANSIFNISHDSSPTYLIFPGYIFITFVSNYVYSRIISRFSFVNLGLFIVIFLLSSAAISIASMSSYLELR